MNIIQAMTERRSIRSFNGHVLDDDIRTTLSKAADESSDPFGGSVTIRLNNFDLKNGYRPGTYGMIKGASDFFLIGMKDDELSALSAGFRFEQVVLKAWQLGLGCCWIAATFKGSDFDRGQQWPDGERLKIICPVGIPAKPALLDKLTRATFRSSSRKPFDRLFFLDDFNHPVGSDNRFHEALQMLRLAPSSTNSQPWRALIADNTVHFYYKPISPLSVIDCGIGMCHFHETEMFYGRRGIFAKHDDAPVPPDNWRYIMSYTA
ncbi:MAG: nitroreductase family protein, partial [Muribaculaceae bacterium]|nr:nitroreductase family protein [Muribaculaceae bacterium]